MSKQNAIIRLYVEKIKHNQKLGPEGIESEKKRIKQLLHKITNQNVYSVYQFLPLDRLNDEEKIKILYHILNEMKDRETVSNMDKSDVNRDYSQFIMQPTNNWTVQKEDNIDKDIKYMTNCNRKLIRDVNLDKVAILNTLKKHNDLIYKTLSGTRSLRYFENYMEYVTDSIIQWIIYRVITQLSPEEAESTMKSIMYKLEELSSQAEKETKKWGEEQKKSHKLYAEETCGVFASFLEYRAKYEEYISVVDVLIQEIEKDSQLVESKRIFNPVSDQYKVAKQLVSDDEIQNSESIITEGKAVFEYAKKLEETQKTIKVFRDYGGRDCYVNSLQDVKVYFREMFLSKAKYRKRQTMRIMREYLEKVDANGASLFDNSAHYIFIREKISRGYFREKGTLHLYIQKAKIQKSLYQTVLKLYQFYDYDRMIDFIHDINFELIKHEHLKANPR